MSNLAPTHSSSIRVFVQWKEQTVFAGERVECSITFKNVAAPVSSPQSTTNHFHRSAPRKSPSQLRTGSPLNPHAGHPRKGHRLTSSLNLPAGSLLRSNVPSNSWSSKHRANSGDHGSHKRSVSIISIGTNDGAFEDGIRQNNLMERSQTKGRGHGRSASLQMGTRGLGIGGNATTVQRTGVHPSSIVTSPTSSKGPQDPPPRRRPGVSTAPNTPDIGAGSLLYRKMSGPTIQPFKFPASPTLSAISGSRDAMEDEQTDARASKLAVTINESPHPGAAKVLTNARVLSPASISGTPRSSGEFYSLSNNSTETLASEYVPPVPSRVPFTGHARRTSNLASVNSTRSPETLMMGYAQVYGSFTLDGSLITQAPFEDVKRKGAVGGQGGGVIGIESNKRDSGLLRSFGWSNLGESLGGLLGGNELSSMKDMRGVANSRSIPLLSTPQSILFVDLRLHPGESKTYTYSFQLPHGLPPTHRGKAIKISYKLVIGTQRPGGAKEQQVKSIEIPFRLLGSVNSYGELLGHDLLSPYIILSDKAQVMSVEDGQDSTLVAMSELRARQTQKIRRTTSTDFADYVNELLINPRKNSSFGLLSPTQMPHLRRQSATDEVTTAKEAIDMAILRSNAVTDTQQSANRFEISRGGKMVAVIMIPRPAYRLGETITMAINFANNEVPCYAIHLALETAEKVDHTLALRSEASIYRVTRKVHAEHSESTLFARRVMFSPTIPISATPEFITTGVSLAWRIRVEFVTPSLLKEGDNVSVGNDELLERVLHDDRGAIFASAETLVCESFEVFVPIRVFGAVMSLERDDIAAEGLVV